MKRSSLILLLCMEFLFHAALNASTIRHFDVKNGLSESTVRGVVQDSRGYIWIGTQDGINKFNGNEFTPYRCSYRSGGKQEDALNIMALTMHPNKRDIVIASKSAIEYLNPISLEFRRLDISYDIEPVCIAFDKAGKLWIGCENGLFTFDESTGISENPSPLQVNALHCDSTGRIWIGTESGLVRHDPATMLYEHIHIDNASDVESIASIMEDSQGNMWVGLWHGGFVCLDKKSGTWQNLSPEISPGNGYAGRIRFLKEMDNDCFLMCTNLGLFEYNSRQHNTKNIRLGHSNAAENIYTCLQDHEGGLWIGTYFNGIYYISPDNGIFECYRPDNATPHFRGTAVSAFCEDRKGRIWIGTENGGLNLFDPRRKEFLPLPVQNPADNIHALFDDGKYLYVGTFSQGLKKINLSNGETQTYRSSNRQIPNDHIFCLKKKESRLYIGTMCGCAALDMESGEFDTILADCFIYSIADDRYGNIWFADYHNGLHRLDSCGKWHHYRHEEGNDNSIPADKLTNVSFDGTDLWICTEGHGICRYDYDRDRFKIFQPEHITFGIAYGVMNDPAGRLWISTNHGIFSCDKELNTRHFISSDNLQSEQFNYGGVFRSRDGLIYLGGVDGFNILHPLEDEKPYPAPQVCASIAYLDHGQEICTPAEIANSENWIRIPRHAKGITLKCECLSYISPQSTVFLYSVDLRNSEEKSMGGIINFADFPYGKHIVRIKAVNGLGIESNNTVILHINNLPPLYLSTGAIALYIICFLAAIYVFIRMVDNRRKEKMEYEAYQAKINFFTQIAHEIKTPVTLIKGPLEMIMKEDLTQWERQHLNTISKNTDRLLTLIGQLLDFKKVNNEGYRIRKNAVKPADIVNNVSDRFDIESSDNITIFKYIQGEIPTCMLDSEAYTKIVSNLLSNAFKHARSRIEIELGVREQSGHELLHLSVRDDGNGISENDASMIFETFYQSGRQESRRMGGVGLGLPLVRLLAQKHGGRVWWNPEWHNGCEMCVDIPLERYAPTRNIAFGKENKIRVLVVEDIPEMLDFICEALSETYSIQRATNGKEALDKLKKSYFDAVVSDIAMPVMDGFELLKAIRTDSALKQTAFILLTAETSQEAKITGLENGSDAYIEKPFSIDQLQATIDNIVRSRNTEPVVVHNDFVTKVADYIKSHEGENDIAIDDIASVMNMSRSSFQRKIKTLTGLSAGEFIRSIRLQQAAALLASGQYRVSEVCFRLGFNKPSYFAACFKKQYGVLPKDYMNRS